MRQEETGDIATILVEPGDEKVSVVRWVGQQSKPVVVLLTENAAIRRPGDLLELKRVASERDSSVILVILGNEPLRLWARRQGFTAFSSTEACTKAFPQHRITQPLRRLQEQKEQQTQPELALLLQLPQSSLFAADRWEDVRLNTVQPQSPVFTIEAWEEVRLDNEQSQRNNHQPAETWQELPLHEMPVLIKTKKLQDTEPIVPGYNPEIDENVQRRWQEKILLILTLLLILGILGGLGFGYLLTVAHNAPGPVSPASFHLFYQL